MVSFVPERRKGNDMNELSINKMTEVDKPRERLIRLGRESLSDAELLALIIGSGTEKYSAIDLARLVLQAHPVHKGLAGLQYLTINELQRIPGIGRSRACQLAAAAEIAGRTASEMRHPGVTLCSSGEIADYFMERTRYYTRERVYGLFFSSANELLREVMLTKGSVNRSLISPREVFLEALRSDAVSVVLLHNHPSGNPEPSSADLAVTLRIRRLGDELGIILLDHIIIGDDCYVSLAERGYLNREI